MLEYVFKGVAGMVVVVLMSAIAKTKFLYLAGLAPLFPTFALFAHVFAYQSDGTAAVKQVVYFGLLSIFPYSVYLLSVLLLIERMSLIPALLLSVVAWSGAALIIFFLWNWIKP
ncbi:MAG: GlpM family protein [Saccharospirillum sp.]